MHGLFTYLILSWTSYVHSQESTLPTNDLFSSNPDTLFDNNLNNLNDISFTTPSSTEDVGLMMMNTNDADVFLADNNKVDDSCVLSSLAPFDEIGISGIGTGIEARANACVNPDNSIDSGFTSDDERLRSEEEVHDYWCYINDWRAEGKLPVCSRFVAGVGTTWVNQLLSTLLTPLNYLLCLDNMVFCCDWWAPTLPIESSPLALTPLGYGYSCYRSIRKVIP